ncbi:MAG: sigma-70 family RNA polymerase sigma factor [Acidobacteria bacterium]|nr:sigma-70 family RNA polymerase sigma factor [Acidobacteriota bacterium]
MTESQFLAERFEQNRNHLRAVAYRILGSLSEADDAVQEAWLRFSRTEADSIDNLGGWLTTVVSRVCLDMLRSRNSRREDELDEQLPGQPKFPASPNPEQEALLADSVGLAVMVVLDRLAPAERLAFVLHDMFDLSFDEISAIIGRSPVATRQLASRARKRIRGAEPATPAVSRQKRIVDAFLAALRAGDVNALVSVLDPNLVVRTDPAATTPALPTEIRGAEFWARQAIKTAQGARAARAALINGDVGLVIAPRGHLFRIMRFTYSEGKISEIDVIGDRTTLANLDLALMDQ